MKQDEEFEEIDVEFCGYSDNFIQTLRDNKWKSINANLLIGKMVKLENDIIRILPNQKFQTSCECTESHACNICLHQYAIGDIYKSSTELKQYHIFRVIEAPIIKNLKVLITSSKVKPNYSGGMNSQLIYKSYQKYGAFFSLIYAGLRFYKYHTIFTHETFEGPLLFNVFVLMSFPMQFMICKLGN